MDSNNLPRVSTCTVLHLGGFAGFITLPVHIFRCTALVCRSTGTPDTYSCIGSLGSTIEVLSVLILLAQVNLHVLNLVPVCSYKLLVSTSINLNSLSR
eukprot:SAG31_NODE_20_length_34168_cov_33.651296_38_plen_98_part_00